MLEKRKANDIDKELATNSENFIKAGLSLTFEGLNIDNRTAQAITLQLEETKIELKNTKKKLQESSIMIDQLHEQLERTSSTVDPESVSDIIDQLINKRKLGSSVLVSTNIYLELVLNQSCPMCGNKKITSHKHTIKVIRLNIHIIVICSNCGTQMNYNNETNGIDFLKAVAAAGLVGVNYVNWKQFEQPIMKYYSKCVYAAITCTANLDIKSPTDNELFDMQTKTVIDHLRGKHDKCWPEVCWIVENPDLKLGTPNLITYSIVQYKDLEEFLRKIMKLPDYPKSFAAHHALAVLHNNVGLVEMLTIIRKYRRAANVAKIEARNQARAQKIMNQKACLKGFNFDQDLVPYGQLVQKNLETMQFHPSFATKILNFKTIIKCGNKDEPDSKNRMLDAIVRNNTLCILPTGRGKTFIYASSALLFMGLTVVFTPLKALMGDQMINI
ncbi:16176_t:CDS:2, partial [Cetraspora pellucida]